MAELYAEVEGNDEEIFRKTWKYQKRNVNEIVDYVLSRDSGMDSKMTHCLDVLHPMASPQQYRELVFPVKITNTNIHPDLNIQRAFSITGRPGFIFIPNPFTSVAAQARWIERLAVEYPVDGTAERNSMTDQQQCSALDNNIRWATLGYHYDWKNRRYTEDRKSPFPPELDDLAKHICASVGQSIVSETAIINYYRRKTTMGGHKDDAEWTDEASVVAISFGPSGVYVLGGDSHADAGPPAPIPIIVRNGDVVLLGGPSRMNVHGVPCMLPGTFPKDVENALSNPDLRNFMSQTRINVNVRQVRPTRMILDMLKRKTIIP